MYFHEHAIMFTTASARKQRYQIVYCLYMEVSVYTYLREEKLRGMLDAYFLCNRTLEFVPLNHLLLTFAPLNSIESTHRLFLDISSFFHKQYRTLTIFPRNFKQFKNICYEAEVCLVQSSISHDVIELREGKKNKNKEKKNHAGRAEFHNSLRENAPGTPTPYTLMHLPTISHTHTEVTLTPSTAQIYWVVADGRCC